MMTSDDVKKEGAAARGLQRRRLKVFPPEPGSRLVKFEVLLRSPEDVQRFYSVAKKPPRTVSNRLLKTIEKIGEIKPKQRNRTGVLQPQVPRSLFERFKKVAERGGTRRGAACLNAQIRRWVNPRTGEFRESRRGNPLRELKSFIARGEHLIERAHLDGEKLERYCFDARKSKRSITRLRKIMDLTLSEFFSALMERVCEEVEPKGGG